MNAKQSTGKSLQTRGQFKQHFSTIVQYMSCPFCHHRVKLSNRLVKYVKAEKLEHPRDTILDYLKRSPESTLNLVTLTGMTKGTVKRYLTQLRKEGRIERMDTNDLWRITPKMGKE